jgi:tetratricopeptide (TPR) repeat protein
LAFLAQISFHSSFVAGVSLYILAMCLFARGASPESISLSAEHPLLPNYFRGDWPAVLALVGIAAFFRLYRIDTQPASLWLDESLTGLIALEIIEGGSARLWSMTPLDAWRPDWVKTTNVYLYFVVAILKTFDLGYFGLKLISLLARGRIDEAVEQLLVALRLQPEKVDIHENLGRALAVRGEGERAAQHYKAALRLLRQRRVSAPGDR